MKFITEEENRKILDAINNIGWENYMRNSTI